MSKDDFSSKSKEALATIAVTFQLVTPDQANAMSQEELADLLNREQMKSSAEPKKDEAPKESSTSKAKKTQKEPAKKKAADAASEKTTAKKAPASKRTKKSSDDVKEVKEEPAKEEASPESAKEAKKETPKKSKKVKKEEPKQVEAETTSEVSRSPEAPSKEDAAKTQAKSDSKKKGKGKKSSKNEEASSEDKKTEEPSSESVSEEPKAASEEKKEVPSQPSQKKGKQRHRSVEIRPANETAPAVSAEGEEATDKIADGENPQENNKPQIEPIEFSGVLEIVSEGGYGFVRRENYLPSPQDVFVPTNLIRRFGLRMGDKICGFALPKRGQDKNLALSYITTVNDVELDKLGKRPHFERLTPIYPDERFRLETGKQELSTRIIDLVSPIGKGQRGMIVSPPKAGKTILLQKIANAISQNSPKTKLIVLLIDERPEEVTDMQRSIKGEVVYSTFDKKPENHTRVTELVLERAMRLVEMGEDVVILLDSMTRLARAYNLTITPTGRTLSGGLDPGSLYGPKRFFGAARNIENGGSLTIVATSLIETGSRMDEVIFEEFKGTGNMEVYLDRKLSEKRIFPAIDINKSGTRREDLLMSQEELDAVWTIRKAFSQMETAPVTETIINLLLRTNSNDHFIRSVKVSFADKEVFDAMRGTGANGSANGNANGNA